MKTDSKDQYIVTFPKLRFLGYKSKLREDSVGNLTSYIDYRGRTPAKTNKGIQLITSKNIKHGYIDYEISKEYIDESDYSTVMSRGLPKIGDILITTEAPYGHIAQITNEKIALAQRIIKLSGNNKISNDFLHQYMLSSYFQNRLDRISSGGTAKGFSGSELRKQKIVFPSYEEQEKIGMFLSKFDIKILLIEKKIEKLKIFKKALLEKLLTKSNIPVLRFSEFNNDWKKHHLEDIVLFLDHKRKALSSSVRINKKGKYPYYGASGIIDYIDEYIFDITTILLSEDGSNIINRNTSVSFIAKGKYWVSNHAHVLKVNDENNIYFIRESLENLRYDKYNTSSVQPKLNAEVCKKIVLKIPEKLEQTKIATFLVSVDKKIALLEKKNKELKQFKKGLLQKMFV